MGVKYFYLLVFLVVVACGNKKRPGLSDKELFAQQKVDMLQESEQEPDFSDMETYVVPPGIKYTESRAVDPANPPVVIDIANRNLNIRKFDLSDYYTKVRYVKIKHPMPKTEGNFLFDALYYVMYERGMASGSGFNSVFLFSDDYIVAGDTFFGLHCYDKEGNFLYTIESNNYPKIYNASQNSITYNIVDSKGFTRGISTIKNKCLYQAREDNINLLCFYDLDNKERLLTRPFDGRAILFDNLSMANYVYEPVNAAEDFLFTLDLKGDTLCRFPNYNPIPEITGRGGIPSPPPPDIYYYNKQLTIRQTLNDTVYRVVSPGRLAPAYVLNFGIYRADIPTYFIGDLSEKLLPRIWKEADQYILFVYTQNRDTQNNRQNGSVRFFYSYYDRKSSQFYHFSEGTSTLSDQFFMENPIPDALPFMLSYAEIEDNQLRVFYTKKRLDELIKNKEFTSLPSEQQDKLKTLQNELEDNEVLIMILE